jgi:Cu/Ag efflux pump CusA
MPLAGWMMRGYERTLAAVIRSRRRIYAASGAVLLAGVVAVPFLSRSDLPSFRDGTILIDLEAVPGTSLPEMDRITTRVGNELVTLPGVLDVGAHVGRAITSDQVVGVDAAQLWVTVDTAADYDAALASIREVVEGYPGLDHAVRTYSDERIASVLGDTETPILIRLFGQDFEMLQQKADEVMTAIGTIDGIVHPRAEFQSVEPTLDVRVDLRRVEGYGIVPGDVRRAAASLVSGIGVGSLFEQQKVFDVVVWGTPETRNSLSSVRNLLMSTPRGRHVRLGRVADVAIASTPSAILHRDNSRSIDVTADVEGRDAGAVAADVRERLRDVTFPLEYHAELVGDSAERRTAGLRALTIAVAAAIGIFLLLQAAFASWRLAAVMFLVLPLGVSGGVLAMLAAGRVASLGSLVGLVAVLAVGVRTGVILIRRYQHLQRAEGAELDVALVERGSRERFVPIVTTAVAVALAFLPFVLSRDVAGQEIVRPMALVILGGLLTSTLVNLFVVPSLYLVVGWTVPQEESEPERIVTLPEVERVLGD